ncbi:AfsR/SARP family transcriptional regulator [Streptomyces sp. NPDC005551]|uniref:AfsR/SARP family transcriptional regulator n=1 Tax=unclassified Streptomyces TaxID=2593676 RepID=UPI0033CC2DA7
MIAKVLGPLQVTLNGTSVVPTALKARKLLAVLILNRGRVVQRATIERELWGNDAPMSASTGIQNCIMQIRKSLGCAGGRGPYRALPKETLITEPTGYRLEVPGEQFDISCYRALVATAAEAQEQGDLTQASAQLNNALSLWRDAPLSDIPVGAVLQSHVLRLAEDRKSVLSQRLALDLKLRRYSEVLGELRALTALHPYDEVLHEYLMLALHLSGRRNDALAAYQDVRNALAAGTGLEPAPRLQSLQRRILNADDTLELGFVGRPAELARR